MARKVTSGAALSIALGTQDEEGNWQQAGVYIETKNNTVAASGDNEVVATPLTGQRIVVTSFVIQNESQTATTMILRAGTSSNGWRYLAAAQGSYLSMVFAYGHEWRLPANTPLNLNLSGANQCGYSVSWYLENV